MDRISSFLKAKRLEMEAWEYIGIENKLYFEIAVLLIKNVFHASF